MQVETVKIIDSNKRGFKVINKSNFDAELHKLYGTVEAKPKKTRAKKAKAE
jgi:hypothetical protein